MYKKLNDDTGFSIVEVLIVIVVILALSGAGWFVYSKNNAKSKTVTADNLATKSEEEVPVKVKEKTLIFSQWGVEMPIGDTSTKYMVSEYKDYSADDNPGHGVYYINLDIKGCDSDASVGAIERFSANSIIVSPGMFGEESKGKTWKQAILEQQGDKAVVIDDYIFTFGTPQAGCATDPFSQEGENANNIQQQATSEVSLLFKDLRAKSE